MLKKSDADIKYITGIPFFQSLKWKYGVFRSSSALQKDVSFGLFLVNYVYRHTGCILAGVKPVDPVVNCMILPYDVHDLRIRFAALLFIMFVDSP